MPFPLRSGTFSAYGSEPVLERADLASPFQGEIGRVGVWLPFCLLLQLLLRRSRLLSCSRPRWRRNGRLLLLCCCCCGGGSRRSRIFGSARQEVVRRAQFPESLGDLLVGRVV